MLGGVLIFVGAALMLFGATMLGGWISGKGAWSDADIYTRPGRDQKEWLLLDLHFLAKIIAPLMAGAVLILVGLRRCL